MVPQSKLRAHFAEVLETSSSSDNAILKIAGKKNQAAVVTEEESGDGKYQWLSKLLGFVTFGLLVYLMVQIRGGSNKETSSWGKGKSGGMFGGKNKGKTGMPAGFPSKGGRSGRR